MEAKKTALLNAIEQYNENDSIANLENLLKFLVQNAHLRELITHWKEKITKQLLIDNLDVLIDIALEEFEPEKEFQTSFKITDNGNLFRFYLQSDVSKKLNYLKNIWLSQISNIDTQIKEEDFFEESFARKEKILELLFTKNHRKGFYFYGFPGLGKSFLLQYIIVERARQGESAAFVNTSDLRNFLSGNIHESNNVVQLLKKVDVLALDDIGSERYSEWFRDTILFDVLQYRGQLKKETHFSSNYALKNLVNEVSDKTKPSDLKRAFRFVERIKELATTHFIKGKNWRDNKNTSN